MKVFEKILVAVDFSDASFEALAQAATLAKLSGASLQIVHVVDDIAGRYLEFPFSAVGHLQTGVTEAAEQQLCDLAQREDLRNVRPRPVVLTSANPAEAIVHQADEESIDLIVMGTHGRPPMVRLLLGSVAERVVRTAHCPVMVVRAPLAAARVSGSKDKTTMPVHA
jgi:nucleotide-binding universal stress UspA family protein